jgi:hypothetical protein
MHRLAVTLFAGLTLAAPPVAAELAAPNPALTPGAVASHNLAEVCARDPGGRYTFSPSHRTWHNKPDTLAKYGIPRSEVYLYEDDDRLPLCAGNDNASPANHWPQPWDEARLKDQLEREICIRLCDRRSISLDEAQAIFLGDWRVTYRKIFGSERTSEARR